MIGSRSSISISTRSLSSKPSGTSALAGRVFDFLASLEWLARLLGVGCCCSVLCFDVLAYLSGLLSWMMVSEKVEL